MEDAYEILARNKGKEESFSDVIRRISGKKDIMKFAGAWEHMSDKDAEDRKKGILKLRKEETNELFRKVKKI